MKNSVYGLILRLVSYGINTGLIEKEDIESPEYVTVTINDEFISKADVPETEVKDGDVVEFLYYMGGGAR